VETDLLARVEERIISVIRRLDSLENKLLNGFESRINTLEQKVALLESSNSGFMKWGDIAYKVASTIVAAWICWHLGFKL
jgi:hypothetical protein